MFFDPRYFLFIAPALLLAFLAQMRVKSAYAKASQVPASMSGAMAARRVLDSAGLTNVAIEEIPGRLSDHYDPRGKVLRLSSDVYHSRSQAAVGIAAHEAGHALQDAAHYAPLVVRNLAVPAASCGSGLGLMLVVLGAMIDFSGLILIGIIAFSCVVAFQLINLPVEFNASTRAKRQLVEQGIVSQADMSHVRSVLSAAALTYVAATLQSILTLLYLLSRFGGRR
jgi:Zn-dependent membrane protease YugP